jgi:hypothetical protein
MASLQATTNTPGVVGPSVSQPVTPAVMTRDLRTLSAARAWRPGDQTSYGFDGSLIGPPSTPDAEGPAQRDEPQPLAVAPAAIPQFSTPTRNFPGIEATGFIPPDVSGDVGPNHYIQMVNAAFLIFDKTGTRLTNTLAINSLWVNETGVCNTTNRGDPIVLYDHLADRWMLSQFAFDLNSNNRPMAPYHECIAISRTADPVTGGWFLYDFEVHTTKFNDYPKFGVWPDAYYMSANQDGSGGNTGAWAFDRAQMLNGAAATFVYFDVTADNFLLPSDLDGATAPPAGAPNYFARFQDGTPDQLEVFQFHVDWTTPSNSTFTGPQSITTAAFDPTVCNGFLQSEECIPQPGTTQGLASIPDRLMWRLQYRNFGTHETLVANHTVDADNTDHAGVRWYELRRTGGGWSIFQQSTYAPDATHRWMGSIAMDKDGNIALGYSVSSNVISPSIRYAGRLAADPLGTLPQGEYTLTNGVGVQTRCQSTSDPNFCRGRWGDYSTMSVDPVNDCTFWYTQEFIPASGDWETSIGAFRFCNTAPVARAGGPYTTVEGTNIPLNGTNSSDLDDDPLTYEWDLDNDGAFDDATGSAPIFDRVGQDGVFPIALRVIDSVGASAVGATTVTVINVAPTVVVSGPSTLDEGADGIFVGIVTDPGWLDPLTATIDWGDGSPPEPIVGTLENDRPDATLTFSSTHLFGDNGAFNASLCAQDDDTSTCTPLALEINNVAPTVEISRSQAIQVNGVPTFLLRTSEDRHFFMHTQDPGSDDLAVTWDWSDSDRSPDRTTTYLVNPPNPDPLPSPSLQPRDIVERFGHDIDSPCVYSVTVQVTDDDGGIGADQAPIVVQGKATRTLSASSWRRQLRDVEDADFGPRRLECYLAITGYMSRVFNEVRDASTIEAAIGVLTLPSRAKARDQFDRQLLAVWLNFANGAIAYDELVDTDGDRKGDTPFATVVAVAEAVRLNPLATEAEIKAQKKILDRIKH